MKRIKCHVKRYDNRWVLKRAGELLTDFVKAFKSEGDSIEFEADTIRKAIDDAQNELNVIVARNEIRRSKYGYWYQGKWIRYKPFHIYGDDPVYTEEEIKRMES